MQHELGMNEMEMNKGTASASLEDLTQYPTLVVDQLLRGILPSPSSIPSPALHLMKFIFLTTPLEKGWFAELCIGHETKNEYNIHDPAAKARTSASPVFVSWVPSYA
jgi:hypothetical protein